jgi:hypothetical protein
MLHKAVLNTLKTADSLSCKSVSIPAISSGIFGFPKILCAETFFRAISEFSMTNPTNLQEIRLTNFDLETASIFEGVFSQQEKKETGKGPAASDSPDKPESGSNAEEPAPLGETPTDDTTSRTNRQQTIVDRFTEDV